VPLAIRVLYSSIIASTYSECLEALAKEEGPIPVKDEMRDKINFGLIILDFALVCMGCTLMGQVLVRE